MMLLSQRNTVESSAFVIGALLVLLTACVSLPLTIITVIDKGGPLGFETMGLTVLVPLCAYILFGVSGLVRDPGYRRRLFVVSHVVSVFVGILYSIIFPVYPVYIVIVPMFFAALGIVDRRNSIYYLLFMQALGVVANVVLLVWEFNSGKSLPLMELLGK